MTDIFYAFFSDEIELFCLFKNGKILFLWGKRKVWSKYFESKVSVYIVDSLDWEDDESISISDIRVLWEEKFFSASSVLACVFVAGLIYCEFVDHNTVNR